MLIQHNDQIKLNINKLVSKQIFNYCFLLKIKYKHEFCTNVEFKITLTKYKYNNTVLATNSFIFRVFLMFYNIRQFFVITLAK